MDNATSIHTGTPTITVLDNRNQAVRMVQFSRSDATAVPEVRITGNTIAPTGKLVTQADPRLGDANLTNTRLASGLQGAPLHRQGVDDGEIWTFADILGRPRWQRDSAGTISTFEVDALGRTTTVSRLPACASAPIVCQRHYYGDTAATAQLPRTQAQIANLCGQPVCTWDSAGRQSTAAISLAGTVLDSTRQLLLKSDSEGDWSGDDRQPATWKTWESALEPTGYRSVSTVNANSSVLTFTDAAGHKRRQAYDMTGALSGQWLTLKGQAEQVVASGHTFNAAGQPLSREHGNGVTLTYGYEPQSQRLISSRVVRQRAGKTSVLQALAYTYDPVGNVLSITDASQSTTWFRNQQLPPTSTFTYDTLYQLTSASGREAIQQKQTGIALPDLLTPLPTDASVYTGYTRTFTYDRGGNLTQIRHSAPKTSNQWTRTLVISATSNQGVDSGLFSAVTASTVAQYFDPRGQQLQVQPGQALSWDLQGRLQQVRIGTAREYYAYAGATRVLKVSEQPSQSSNAEQRVVYADGLEIRTDRHAQAATEVLHILPLDGARVLHWEMGKPTAVTNDSIRYSYGDALGSLQLEVDQQGDIVSREEYYPYGGTALWAAANQTDASYKTRRYCGKERDATGLYYYGYRYYQPWAGRWLSADPAGPADGLNLYSMVRNNPVSNRDQLGLSITIGKDKYLTEALFKESAVYKNLVATYAMEKIDRLVSHYNAVGEESYSQAHFNDLVKHDIDTHLANDALSANQTAQRDYLTRTGWHGRLKNTRPADFPATQRPQVFWKGYAFATPTKPLDRVDTALGQAASAAEVSVYRTMTHMEAQELLANQNYDAIGKHLGDYPQALSYFHRDGDNKVLLEFPLKPGAHEALFTPAFSAVLDSGNVTSVMAKLAELNLGGKYAKAKKGEGSLAGYIGIKPEKLGVSGFSLSLGDRSSRELFKHFVRLEGVRELHRR